jgi:hypothetical protein
LSEEAAFEGPLFLNGPGTSGAAKKLLTDDVVPGEVIKSLTVEAASLTEDAAVPNRSVISSRPFETGVVGLAAASAFVMSLARLVEVFLLDFLLKGPGTPSSSPPDRLAEGCGSGFVKGVV